MRRPDLQFYVAGLFGRAAGGDCARGGEQQVEHKLCGQLAAGRRKQIELHQGMFGVRWRCQAPAQLAADFRRRRRRPARGLPSDHVGADLFLGWMSNLTVHDRLSHVKHRGETLLTIGLERIFGLTNVNRVLSRPQCGR
jgi:hypothetical protein